MSLPTKTGLSLAFKLKNGYPAMGVGGVSRYYTIFDPGYVDLVTSRTLSVGDTISVKFATSDTQSSFAPLFDSDSPSPRVAARTGATGTEWNFIGTTNMKLDGAPVVNGDAFPNDGGVHTLTLTVGFAANIRYISTNFALSVMFSGIIFDFQHFDSLGNPIISLPLDTDSLTIARETLNADGGELVSVGSWSLSGGQTISNESDTSFTLNADGSPRYTAYASKTITLTQGMTYKVLADISEGGARCEVRQNFGSGSLQVAFSGDEDGTVFSVATTGLHTLRFYRWDAGAVDVDVSGITLKETTDALYIDVQSEDKVQELP